MCPQKCICKPHYSTHKSLTNFSEKPKPSSTLHLVMKLDYIHICVSYIHSPRAPITADAVNITYLYLS